MDTFMLGVAPNMKVSINAMAARVIELYKTECVKIGRVSKPVDKLELATLSWVHWFNENRLHSSLDNATPAKHEHTTIARTTPDSSRCRES